MHEPIVTHKYTRGSPVMALAVLTIAIWIVALRMWDINQPFIGDHAWNEVYYAYIARSFKDGQWPLQFDIHTGASVYSTPLVPTLIWASFAMFGTHEWAARLPIALFGILTLPLLYCVVRLTYSPKLAIISVFFAGFAPGIVFFSRNVQLDGVMTAMGLGAIAALLQYGRSRSLKWLILSMTALMIAVMAKYTAVLFLPALAWVWLSKSCMKNLRRDITGFGLYMIAAVLPSAIWIIWVLFGTASDSLQITQIGGLDAEGFFFRFSEMTIANFVMACISIWKNTVLHLGGVILFPAIISSIILLISARRSVSVGDYILPMLLVLPWYLQIFYPQAWLANEYYDYPALYGMCILIGASLMATLKRFWDNSDVNQRTARVTIAVLVVVIAVASTWAYRADYRSSYYPWPLNTPHDPFSSARHVAEVAEETATILADLPFTVYYTEATPPLARYSWWGMSDEAPIVAISSRQYDYIVFTYPPTISIINAIGNAGYHQIAASAWQLRSNR